MTTIDLGAGELDEPVSIGEAKTFARIDRNDEDVLIGTLIRAARLAAEAMTEMVLVRRSFRLALDPVPSDGWIEASRRPVAAVTAITAYTAGGAPVAFEPSEAIVERVLGLEAFRLSPQVRAAATNGVEIEFTAGLGPGEVAEDIRHAILLIAAAAYEMRGAVAADMQPALMPPLARALLTPHRRLRL